jgi:putative MFS transporter
MLVGYIYPIWGFAGVFGMTTVILLIGALAVVFLGVSTSGKTLEEITADEYGDGRNHGGSLPPAKARV